MIGIQGGVASFHEQAAKTYFGTSVGEVMMFPSFRKLCHALAEGRLSYAVMAIENTLAGCILPNYALLEESEFVITGEIYLRIEHQLMALPGQSLSEITTVWSHPMALMQCSNFLEAHQHIRCVEADDTAESARRVSEENISGVGAIASKAAAERYKLQILQPGIENLHQNYTRFLVLSRKGAMNDAIVNKASFSLRVSHQPGSLVEVLDIFRQRHINLTLIQSIPIQGRPQEYAFHIDVEWDNRDGFHKAMSAVNDECVALKLLGLYKKGELPHVYTNG